MMRFLVLRLRGPLMSFGGVAVDEIRPSETLPGVSMLTGMFGNALGWRYRDLDRLAGLQARLIVAARLDRPGEALVDFQTADISVESRAWRIGTPPITKRSSENQEAPVPRYRHYRADAGVSVAVSLSQPDDAPTLDDLAVALARPARPLFLGRCSCPPAEPVFRGEFVEAASAREALQRIAPLDWADGAENYEAEWPADSADVERGWQAEGGVTQERRDLRDWVTDVHAGWRYVVRGPLNLRLE